MICRVFYLALFTAATALGAAKPPAQIEFQGVIAIPARLPDGTIFVIGAERRPLRGVDADHPAQPVFMRISNDDGRSWSEPSKIFEYPASKGTVTEALYPVVDRAGHIHAFGVRYYHIPGKGVREPAHSVLLHTVSRDAGKTWSSPKVADFGHGYTGAINSIIQLKSGRILGALSYPTDNFVENLGQFEFHTVSFYSDDEAKAGIRRRKTSAFPSALKYSIPARSSRS